METNVLDLKFFSSDLRKEVTIKEYFAELFQQLWKQQFVFSSKRPFGNSDWKLNIYTCLVANKIVEGELDEDGCLYEYDGEKLYDYVKENIIPNLFS